MELSHASNYVKLQPPNHSGLISNFSIMHYLVPDNSVCYIQHKENQLVSIQNLHYFLTLQKTLIIHYTIFCLTLGPPLLTQICYDSFVLASILEKTDAQHSFHIVFH